MVSSLRKIKNKKRRSGLGLISAMVLLICVVVMVDKQNLNREQIVAQARVKKLEQAIEEAQTKAKRIEEQKAYMKTQKYIEEIAREKLGLVYEDEIVFKSKD